jgi:hypothetical protein
VAFELVPEERAHFDQMHVLSFYCSILLMSMRIGNKVSNTNFVKEGVKFFILSSPIGLHDNDFLVKKYLNKSLEFIKFLKGFRPKLDEINLSKFAIIINETYVTLITAR